MLNLRFALMVFHNIHVCQVAVVVSLVVGFIRKAPVVLFAFKNFCVGVTTPRSNEVF